MAKRMIVMLLAAGAVITVLGVFKFQQIKTAIAEGSSFQPPPEAVTTVVTEESVWNASVETIGTATALQGVLVAADLPGIVERIDFESGQRVDRGKVLVVLDSRQERAQLAAAQARLDLAAAQHERVRGLLDKGVTSKAEFDAATAENAEAEARVGEIRAAIDRKTIRAPFSGALGIRQVNLCQYLAAGDPVAPLQSLDPIYVEFSVPQQQVGRMKQGVEVSIDLDGGQGSEQRIGRITALDSVIDPATRNVKVQATFSNADGRLTPGMYVETEIRLDAETRVIAVPASAISYAPYGDAVFVVESMAAPDGASYLGVRQQFVQLGAARGDQVAILSGVEPGQEIVTSGVFKLRSGAAVLVNNEVQPDNDPAPSPQNS
jgi:membrane fusion protein (multidrug efflux system)